MKKIKVAICVPTYLRAHSLELLLHSLNNLYLGKNISAKIFVIDNDINKSAKKVVKESSKKNSKEIRYFVEPRRGISFARNRAVKESINWADFIAFIDDDEEADKYWLNELINSQKMTNADCIDGPVFPKFGYNAPDWILKGKFFVENPKLTRISTNNCLIKSEVLKNFRKPFDESLALIGSEDRDFFMRVFKLGYKTARARKAIVYENIPKSRANLKWILIRKYRGCNMYSRLLLKHFPSIKTLAKQMAYGAYCILLGLFGLPISLILGKYFLVKCLNTLVEGMGALSGIIKNTEYHEYKKIHKID